MKLSAGCSGITKHACTQASATSARSSSNSSGNAASKLPPEPLNTFVNLPATPEKGPLYVLLFDLVNMDPSGLQSTPNDFRIQLFARQQMLAFIKSKPEGARFAVFVRSDELHLVQGFTSDKAQLLATLSPDGPKPSIPKVFMRVRRRCCRSRAGPSSR